MEPMNTLEPMKTLTLGGITYEIIDQRARDSIGNLDELATTDKRCLVAAINELAGRGGGGEVDPSAVQQIVEDYLAENPPEPGEPGKDGVSPTVTVKTIAGGYQIIIEDVHGEISFDIKDGHTPEKGVDYFTDEEIDEVAAKAAERVSAETDHSKLTNRDASDQHPIESITNLKLQLGKKLESIESITNLEINQILGGSTNE